MTAKIYQNIVAQRNVEDGRRVELTFRTAGEAIPAVLLLPARQPAPTPLLMVHGRGNRRGGRVTGGAA